MNECDETKARQGWPRRALNILLAVCGLLMVAIYLAIGYFEESALALQAGAGG